MTVNHLLCLWPGLARLWLRGDLRSLRAAMGFAALLQATVAATLVWPEIAPVALRSAAVVLAGLWWVVAAAMTLLDLPEIVAAVDGDPHRALFVAAQAEYLKGNWIEAEAALRKLLRQSPRDAEAQLLLAALFRRTARLDKARQTLQELSRLDGARRWEQEIRGERELLRRMVEQERLSQAAARGGVASDTVVAGSTSNSADASRRAA